MKVHHLQSRMFLKSLNKSAAREIIFNPYNILFITSIKPHQLTANQVWSTIGKSQLLQLLEASRGTRSPERNLFCQSSASQEKVLISPICGLTRSHVPSLTLDSSTLIQASPVEMLGSYMLTVWPFTQTIISTQDLNSLVQFANMNWVLCNIRNGRDYKNVCGEGNWLLWSRVWGTLIN